MDWPLVPRLRRTRNFSEQGVTPMPNRPGTVRKRRRELVFTDAENARLEAAAAAEGLSVSDFIRRAVFYRARWVLDDQQREPARNLSASELLRRRRGAQ